MRSWIRERRNLIIVSILTLCMAALMIAALPHGSGASKPALGPAPTANAEETPPTAMPVRSPAPADNTSSYDPFQLILHDKYRYFRVSEQNQYWDYKPGHSIWYSRGDATFTLALDASGFPGTSQKQVDMLRGNIAVTTTSGEPVSFTVSEGNGDSQFVISLNGSPASDLTVSFFSADQSQSKPFVIYYMKPFDYKITAEHIPYSDQAFALSAQMIQLPLPVRIGQAHEFVFQFTDEVDRASVDNLFANLLQDIWWKLDWTDNRTFRLTIQFKAAPKERFVYLSASGIRNARGVELKTNRGIWLEPHDLRGYALYDPSTGHMAELTTPARPYDSLSIAPNEDWSLAGIKVETALSQETMYELLNRKGAVIQTFHTGEMYMPKWLSSSSGFIYLDGQSGNRELALFHIANGEKETIWQAPDTKGRIIAFDIDPAGRLAIVWGVFNDLGRMDIQIEIRNGFKDSNPPLTFKKAGEFRCMDGPCNGLIEFIGEDRLLVLDDEGYSALNTYTGQTQQVVSHSASSKHSVRATLQYRSKKWNVQMNETGGKEKWTWSDGEQDIVFTTSIGIPEQAQTLRGPFGAGASALFYVEQKGWFRIDPSAKTSKPAHEVPDTIDPKWIVDQFKGKLVVAIKNQ